MKKLVFAAVALIIITAVLSYLIIPLLISNKEKAENSKNRVLDRFYTVKKLSLIHI